MKAKSNDRNKTLKIKLSGLVGVLEKLVDFRLYNICSG